MLSASGRWAALRARAVRNLAGGGAEGGEDGSKSPLRRLLDGAASYGEPEAPGASELRWATQPYARRGGEGTPRRRGEPGDAAVLLFPGQGAQHVGMGRKLAHVPAARDLYQLASDILGWDVWRVCTEGPASELAARCQPALVVTALAAVEALRDARPGVLARVRAAAGFSLGELSALVWAGALPLERALRLAELRAAAMAAAAAARPQALLTVWLAPDARLSLALLRAREHAAARAPEPVCQVASYLYPGCKVVGGDEEALRFVERRGAEFGVRRSARVAGAAGAFHTPLMAPVTGVLRAALAACEAEAPRVRVVSAVDARPYGPAGAVRRTLARHAAAPQRWEQTLHALYARPTGERFPLTVALGPGGALRATLRQVNAKAWDSSVQIEV